MYCIKIFIAIIVVIITLSGLHSFNDCSKRISCEDCVRNPNCVLVKQYHDYQCIIGTNVGLFTISTFVSSKNSHLCDLIHKYLISNTDEAELKDFPVKSFPDFKIQTPTDFGTNYSKNFDFISDSNSTSTILTSNSSINIHTFENQVTQNNTINNITPLSPKYMQETLLMKIKRNLCRGISLIKRNETLLQVFKEYYLSNPMLNFQNSTCVFLLNNRQKKYV